VNRQILAALVQQNQILSEHAGYTVQEAPKESLSQTPMLQHPEQKNPVIKKASEKKTQIIVGS
jgi:hypothetical protein